MARMDRNRLPFAVALAALALAVSARAAELAAPLDAAAQRQAIGTAAALLKDNYVFPDLGAAAGGRITQAMAAGDYAAIRDPSAFAARLTRDLQAATHDPHVAVIAQVDTPTTPPPPRTNGGFERVDRLKGNVGYAKLDRFPPLGLFRPFADQAMAALASTDALVLDLRDNTGGAAASVTYFASFFFDHPTEVGDLITRTSGGTATTTTVLRTVATPAPYLGKPVYILVGPATFSGGEELADDLQAQKRAVVVGEPTGGGANPGLRFPLVDRRLYIFVPTTRAENPVTKSNWEGQGVQPDVRVPADQALAAAVGALVKQGRAPALAPLLARASAVGPLVEARVMALRNTAQPGGEAALRKLMAGLAAGQPDYADMEADIAGATRRTGSRMGADLARLGEVQSLTFRGVADTGSDLYDVHYAKGAAVWSIYLSPSGKLASYSFAPPP